MDATVKKSLHFDQQDLLEELCALHVPAGFDCDVTYGNGAFYKHGRIREPTHKFDLDPQVARVVLADSGAVPLASGSVNSVMFDPPFLTYVRKGREHQSGGVVMSARFGGYHSYEELTEHYNRTVLEAARIIRKGGVLVVKCQDIIHNHRMHCTHARVITFAENNGFRLLDLFVLGAKHRMPSPQAGTQRHARIFHSYFLVFQRTGTFPGDDL